MRTGILVLLLASSVFLASVTYTPLPEALTGGSTVADARGDCGTPWLDIVNAQVTQVSGNRIQFDTTLSSAPPEAPSEWTSYYWFFDTDMDSTTGKRYGRLGAEYVILLTYNEGLWGAYTWATEKKSGLGVRPVFPRRFPCLRRCQQECL